MGQEDHFCITYESKHENALFSLPKAAGVPEPPRYFMEGSCEPLWVMSGPSGVAIATELGPDITRRGSHVPSMKCLGGSGTPAAESPVGAYTQYRSPAVGKWW